MSALSEGNTIPVLESFEEKGSSLISSWFSSIYRKLPFRQKISPDIATKVVAADSNMNTARQEILAKVISTLLGLSVSFVVSYYGIKWLANALDPTKREKQEAHKRAKEMMKKIGFPDGSKLTEYELCIASNLVDHLSMSTSWQDIGGLDDVIEEIQETVILPFRKQSLFSHSTLLQPPKGVLLYGPPGCGKTMIAKATAKAAGARFLNLQVSSLVDKWYGESQKRAEAVFSLAIKLQPTIIFIDEIDSFLRSRTSTDHEATAMIKTQFMSFWDGLMTDPNCRVMIMGATNRPQDVDQAILRRMPSTFHVGLPSGAQRLKILNLVLQGELVDEDINLQKIAEQTEGFSGSDLRELCRSGAVYSVRDYVRAETEQRDNENENSDYEDALRPINQADLEAALHKMKSTKLTHHTNLQPVELD